VTGVGIGNSRAGQNWLLEQTGVGQLALHHLVPPPQNVLFEKIFTRDFPDGTIISEDGMIFELPAGSAEIRVIAP
jgi:proteasome assembly chaperone (PAC2) family protein